MEFESDNSILRDSSSNLMQFFNASIQTIEEYEFLGDKFVIVWLIIVLLKLCDSSYSNRIRVNQPIRVRAKIYRKNIHSLVFVFFSSFSIGFMVGFNFDHGGRRCIRPILEKYQSGKSTW